MKPSEFKISISVESYDGKTAKKLPKLIRREGLHVYIFYTFRKKNVKKPNGRAGPVHRYK